MKKTIFIFSILMCNFAFSQVGIGTTSPNGALDVTSTTDGLIMPRVALTNTTTATVVTPTASELVYNTATAGDVTPGFYYWDGVKWVRFTTSTTPNNSWLLLGNTGTTASTNFLGTTDNVALNFRVNNIKAGRIGVTTDKSTFLGYEAGLNDDLTDNRNTFVGYQAGKANTTGSSNVALGYQTLQANTTGIYNTVIGREALYNNIDGSRNAANGYFSLYSNTSGSDNIAIGSSSLQGNTTGNSNIAIGLSSLVANTSGNDNIAIGQSALISNTTANSNIAIGRESLKANTNGYSNIAVGYYALLTNTDGIYNTAIGNNTLQNNTTGTRNTAIGSSALTENTTGQYNSGLGRYALNKNTTGGNNSGFGQESLRDNTTGTGNTGNGYGSLLLNTTGNNNVAIGRSALNNTTGSNNIGIGFNVTVPTANGSNQIRIGDANITYAGVQVAWTITSDRRWKGEIQDSKLGLDFIKGIRAVQYTRNNDDSKKIEYGVIAQELEENLIKNGATNSYMIHKDDQGMYGVRYNDLMSPMIKSIQELSTENTNLKLKVEDLETRLKHLEEKLK